MDPATASAYDVVRILALVLGSGIVGAVTIVMSTYVVVYTNHADLTKIGRVSKWRGMLPRHVVAVAVSYVGLILLSMLEIASRLREPATLLAPVCIVLYIIGLLAMWDVLGHARYRLYRMGEGTQPDGPRDPS